MITAVENKPAILCLIDFSEASRQALQWAATEARKQNTRLTILYPYRLNQLQAKNDVVGIRQGMAAEAISNFQQLAKEALSDAQVNYEFTPEIGFMSDRIFAHSHKKEFAMMVISKHMAVNNKDNMMELIDLLKYPLVIVPQSKPDKK